MLIPRIISILLFALSTVGVATPSLAQDVPANAQPSPDGSGWTCIRGYRRAGNLCERVAIPQNAQLNIYGNGWKCQSGYRKVGSGCEKVAIPENAQLNIYGNGWKCQSGYRKVGSGCEAFTVPANATLSSTGNDWVCIRNYIRQGNGCRPMTPQEIARQNAAIAAALACGRSYNFDVQGYCDGDYVYGEVEACSNSKAVTGYIYDENGTEWEFSGEWVRKGEIEGYDGFGDYCELEVD